MKKLVLIFAIFIISFTSVSAQGIEWVIESFDSDIEVLESGKIIVTETIEVDFNINKHGIYRDIPYRYIDKGDTYYTDVDVINVWRDNVSEPYKTMRNDANVRLRIGDPDQAITGNHIYRIKYSVLGALLTNGEHDQLYWNVTGSDWEVPIDRVTASVEIPTKISSANCYIGELGSTDQCETDLAPSQNLVNFLGLTIQPGQDLTVNVLWPSGITDIVYPFDLIQVVRNLLYLFPIITTVVALWYWYRKWDQEGRDPEVNDTKVVQYTPPAGLSVLQSGLLIDDTIQNREIAAMIVDLARRGYLTITELDTALLQFFAKDYQLNRTEKSTSDLSNHERFLLEKVFNGEKMVTISSLKNSLHQNLKNIKTQVGDDMKADNIYTRNPVKDKSASAVVVLLVIAQVAIFVMSMLANYIHDEVSVILIVIGIVTPVIIWLIFQHFMPQRTEHGTRQLEHLLGYKEFIQTAEKHRAKFYEDQNIVFEIMPFAIMFGMAKKFAKSIESMGMHPSNPMWYVGTGNFDFGNFASNVDTMSSELSKTMAVKPASGSGGSGFSGGGFGGGGGGSW